MHSLLFTTVNPSVLIFVRFWYLNLFITKPTIYLHLFLAKKLTDAIHLYVSRSSSSM
ncbi:unnamed protein product [Schistosoma mattheei]|uniref:Uncharacterized protein n=1 Tax=Schistosoma mattheei TaxID=31246 RepID=A0A183PVM1_9TREM|nr:unnamed protein product [Schistosoma mattheei]